MLSGTYRGRSLAQGGTINDYTIQTSVEYHVKNGFSIAVAHEARQNQGLHLGRVGIRLNYTFQF